MCHRKPPTFLVVCICPSDISLGRMIDVSYIPFECSDSPIFGTFAFRFLPGTKRLSFTPFKPFAISIKDRIVGVHRLRIWIQMNISRSRYILAHQTYDRSSVGFFVLMTEINHQLNDGTFPSTYGARLDRVLLQFDPKNTNLFVPQTTLCSDTENHVP